MRNGNTSSVATEELAEAAGGQATTRKAKRMATVGESIRKMMAAHVRGDRAAFTEAARELIADERLKHHDAFARDLERILDMQDMTLFAERRALTPLGRSPVDDLPRDKERGLALVEVRDPVRKIDELVLEPGVLASLQRVLNENVRGELLRTNGLRPANRVLFCGPPGCGKTVTAEAIASELMLQLVVVRFDAVVSSFLGETAANMRKVFDFIRGRAYVVLFDEFDAIGKSRVSTDEHGELKRVVSAFLQLLDNYRGQSLLIAATNHEGMLDSALWRRFDEVVLFGKPTVQSVLEMLTRGFRQIGVSAAVRLPTLARRLEGLSHAEIERIIDHAVKSALMRDEPCVSEEILLSAIDRQQRRGVLAGAPSRNSRRGTRKARSARASKNKRKD